MLDRSVFNGFFLSITLLVLRQPFMETYYTTQTGMDNSGALTDTLDKLFGL
jgi:hypothetical protein